MEFAASETSISSKIIKKHNNKGKKFEIMNLGKLTKIFPGYMPSSNGNNTDSNFGIDSWG